MRKKEIGKIDGDRDNIKKKEKESENMRKKEKIGKGLRKKRERVWGENDIKEREREDSERIGKGKGET
jgi:hypothetical protein